MALDPDLRDQRPHVPALLARRAARPDAAARGTTTCPTRRRRRQRLRGLRAARARCTVDASWASAGHLTAADRARVVPAVPEPLDRHAGLRARRQRSTSGAGDARQLQRPRTGASSAARAASRRTRAAIPTAATQRHNEGGALRAQDVRTTRRPDRPRRRDPPRRPGHRRGRRPATRSPRARDAEQAADHRLRPAQPVPLRVPARLERALARGRRLGRLGGGQPLQLRRRRRRELRLAVLSRATPIERRRRDAYSVAAAVQRACPHSAGDDDRSLAYEHDRDVPPAATTASAAPRSAASRSRDRSGVPGALPARRPVLHRLRAQLHLDAAAGRRRHARAARTRGAPAGTRAARSTSRSDRPRRRPVLRRTSAHGGGADPAHPAGRPLARIEAHRVVRIGRRRR